MEALEVVVKKHNINLDYSSHGNAFDASSFSFTTTSTTSNGWFIDSRASYHMAKDKTIFFLLMNVTPKKFFW
jgi:hypothetical protein